jgi:hypothetical protein
MFYLILPYALQQGEAAFINQNITIAGKNLLSPYTGIFTDVLFFLTMGIAIILIKARYRRAAWTGSALLFLYLIYVLVLWVASFMNYPEADEVFLAGRQFIYISLSYYLWVAVFQSVTRKQYERFLNLLFFVTPVCAILYILNSSRIISIYDPVLLFQEVDFNSTTFFRDFRTIPLWLIPVLVLSALSLITPIFNVSKKIVAVNIVVLPAALLFTFTRSLLFIVLIQVIFLFFLYISRFNGRFVRNIIFLLSFLAISIAVMQKIFPDQSAYFRERLLSVEKEGKDEANVEVRLNYVAEASRIVNENNPFTGAGMNKRYYIRMNATGAWVADSTIPYFLLHTGWIGVVWIFGIVLVFFVDSFFLFLRTRDWLTGYLCAFFLSIFISCLIMGEALLGNVWVMVNFALYAVIKLERWKPEEEQDTPGN